MPLDQDENNYICILVHLELLCACLVRLRSLAADGAANGKQTGTGGQQQDVKAKIAPWT